MVSKEMTTLIHQQRLRRLNQQNTQDKKYVLYWMQSSQRVEYNFALEYAISEVKKLNKPLLAFFGVTHEMLLFEIRQMLQEIIMR